MISDIKLIISDLDSKHIEQLYELYQQMWWSVGRSKEDITTLLKNCIPFAAIHNNTQNLVGFARVLTDEIRYAYIFDVMVQETFRNRGIGKLLMGSIFSHPRLNNVKYFELNCTPEMVPYYEKFGFSKDLGEVVAMRCRNK